MNEQQESKNPQQPEPKKPIPAPEDLYEAWRKGGVEKLAEMLPDVPDEEDD